MSWWGLGCSDGREWGSLVLCFHFPILVSLNSVKTKKKHKMASFIVFKQRVYINVLFELSPFFIASANRWALLPVRNNITILINFIINVLITAQPEVRICGSMRLSLPAWTVYKEKLISFFWYSFSVAVTTGRLAKWIPAMPLANSLLPFFP